VPALAGLAATRGRDATLVRDGGAGVAAERLAGAAVSGQFFAVAGLGPARGRLLGPADDRPGRRACWCSATPRGGACSGADPAVVGRTLRLDGEPHTVVGVAAAALDALTGGAEFFAPLALDPSQRANFTPYLTLVARLAPGTTPRRPSGGWTRWSPGSARPRSWTARASACAPSRSTRASPATTGARSCCC
jgi:hypothetical protein